MNELEKEYDELVKKRNLLIEELSRLNKSEIIQRYKEIENENDILYNKQNELQIKIKKKEYESCQHILICTKIEYYGDEGRTYKKWGCIKCGLNIEVLDYDRSYLSFINKIMYDYLIEKRRAKFNALEVDYNDIKVTCDLSLAQKIYYKIKEAHPDIDDETAYKYFEIALDNIRNIKVNNNRKNSRAKRLSLIPNFKKWNSSDVSDF